MKKRLEERAKVLAGGYHLAYTDPFGAVVFQKSLGFLPIARPRDRFDETILVGLAARQTEGDWRQRRPLRVASATDKLAVHGLGLGLLQDHHITPADCEFQFVGTHLQTVKAVLSGNADVGFVFNETWHELSAAVRESHWGKPIKDRLPIVSAWHRHGPIAPLKFRRFWWEWPTTNAVNGFWPSCPFLDW